MKDFILDKIKQKPTSIELDGYKINNEELKFLLENSPQLIEVKLLHPVDEWFEHLLLLPNLKSLHIYNNRFKKTEALVNLGKLKQLEVLSLDFCEGVTQILFDYLEHFKRLQYLNLTDNEDIDDAQIYSISKITSLKSLTLSRTICSSKSTNSFAKLINLEELSFEVCNINQTLSFLKQITKLKVLHIKNCSVNILGIKNLIQLTSLQELLLTNMRNDIQDNWIEQISNLKSLEKLTLSSCGSIGDKGISYISKLNNLKELDLEGTYFISENGFSFLKSLKKLKKLSLTGSSFNNDNIKFLINLENLSSLNISFTEVNNKSIDKLLLLKSLNTLEITNIKLSPEEIKKLNNKNVTIYS
ncbi:Leucine Rich repeats (2 copies) [Candidatus Rubidus massiliensis]|nr:MAG: hypothetical protein BGO10_04675 [Chlamydia sp. 32-24]CDZ80929.1 Leucine Rich repeats (2 copies) [Candidatus Rubidus massiliensis]